MFKFKKTMCFILIVSMIAAMVFTAGCSKKGEENKGADTQNATVEETKDKQVKKDNDAEENKLEPVELIWYFPWSGEQPDQNLVFEKVNEITKKEINTTINFKVFDFGTYKTKIPVVIASGEPADLIFTANWLNDYYVNVAKSAFVPLDDLLPEYGKNLLQDIPEALFDTARVNGKLYAVPNYQISAKTQHYYARADLLDKYNFDIHSVKKLKDFNPFLEAVKKGEPNVYPIEHRNALWGNTFLERNWEPITDKFPGVIKIGDEKAKVFNQYATDEYKEFCKLMHDWYKKGYIREDILSVDSTNAERKANKYALYTHNTTRYEGEMELVVKQRYGYDVRQVITTKPYMEYGAAVPALTAVSTASKHPERAVMFMNLRDSNTDMANLLAYGIENKHYKKVSDKKIEFIKDSGFNHNTQWSMLNTFKTYVVEPFPDNDKELTLETNEKGAQNASAIAGMAFNLEPINIEVTQCKTLYEEYGKGLEAGVLDPDESLPKYLDQLEKAGASKIIAELQKQIDEYLSNK